MVAEGSPLDKPAPMTLAEGLSCGLHRIERLMRVHGLRARPRRRGLPKDDGLRLVIADNILDRQFTAEVPNQRWIADFTYIWTAEGWLYVAVVIDLFSRRVVGCVNRRPKGTPFVEQRNGYVGRTFRAGCGVGRA